MHKLFIKQKVFKITDHYKVFNEQWKPIYFVDQDFKLLGNTVHVKKADGSESFVIDKHFFTFLPKYKVRFSNGKTLSIKSNFSFFKKNIDAIAAEYSLKLVGNFFDMNFTVYKANTKIGNINKKYLTWGDTYVLHVLKTEHEKDLLALLIVVDNIKDIQRKRKG